jgi:thermitase
MRVRRSRSLPLGVVVGLMIACSGGSAPIVGRVHAAQPLVTSDTSVPLGPPVTVARGGVTTQVRSIRHVRTADGREVVADRLIVGFQPGVTDAEKDAVHRAVAPQLSNVTPVPLKPVGDNAQYVDVTGVPSLDAAIRAYRADARVRYAEPDYLVTPAETPNDPSFTAQYGMRAIQVPAAWDVTHGAASTKIAILDCGIYEAHPDLTGKVVARQDFSGSPYGTDDRCNHGTHVAGIASARTNNGAGVAGVGYSTALMNGKVLLEQFDSAGNLVGASGSSTWIVSGIHWAVDNGARVINLSVGSPFTPVGGGVTCAQTYQDAVNYATTRSVVVVAAAGNDGALELFQPASCAGVLSVASTDQNDVKSSFSNYGPWVNVAAPGSYIYSTVNPNITENHGASYAYFDGTSMATPHVAGLAGLLWTTNWGTDAASIIARIEDTADPIVGATGVQWQSGRINAAKAVSASPPVATGINPSSRPAGSGAFSLTVSGSGFLSGAVVRWNGAARPTTVTSSTQIVAAIPVADLVSSGAARVTVTNPDGNASATAFTFAITTSPPRPTGIAPNAGSTKGGTTVSISGDYFQSGASMTIGGVAATVQSVTGTTIVAVTPAHAGGTVNVVVTNPDGQAATLANAYTYAPEPEPTNRTGPPPVSGTPVPLPAARRGTPAAGSTSGGPPSPVPPQHR